MNGNDFPASVDHSDADTLTFSPEHKERIQYRLNNRATTNLNNRFGGKIQIVLLGTLDDGGDKLAIKDAKLEVIHERALDRHVVSRLQSIERPQSVPSQATDPSLGE